ncbi:MAG TPA: AAA family ATPase [Acetobacteraceae bacterium]|nr:AAA family ATPase [Acetobacteraceae bacterium]
MTVPPQQAEVVEFLRRLAASEPAETHISLVFVGTDTVWKLKKAVRLAFLDFTSVDARRHFAQRELALNGPAAPGLYRDMVPVVRNADGTLGFGDGSDAAAVDWVLRMARIPSADFLDAIASRGGLTPELLDTLGDAVAAFHASLPAATGFDPVAGLRRVIEGNAQAARDAGLDDRVVQHWQTGVLHALQRAAAWLSRRAADGFVRRAHGDLHLGNMCLWQGRPVPFDALEFDEGMATIDLGYDLAFLLMDLDRRASRAAANRVLNRYVARTGDAALTRGLPMFLSLRAMIRAHVEAKRGNADSASGYLDGADGYQAPRPPTMLAIGGLPASGKSTLARALAPGIGNAPGALVLRSDEIRKRQHHAAPEERLPLQAYSDAASEAVFGELAALAEAAASGGHSVIADATFIDPRHRTMIEASARAAGAPFLGCWLEVPLDELKARITARQRDASDANLAVLRAASRRSPGAGEWRAIDASDSTAALAAMQAAVQAM